MSDKRRNFSVNHPSIYTAIGFSLLRA